MMDTDTSFYFDTGRAPVNQAPIKEQSWHTSFNKKSNDDTTSNSCHGLFSNSSKTRFNQSSPYNIMDFQTARIKRLKRRGASPKIFPRKILITEDRVAIGISNLSISNEQHYKSPLKSCSRRQRSFSEIEDSIQLDSDNEVEDYVQIKISEKFQIEIDKFKQDLLYGKSLKSLKSDCSTALVLWKPPSGMVSEVHESLQKSSKKKEKSIKTDTLPMPCTILDQKRISSFISEEDIDAFAESSSYWNETNVGVEPQTQILYSFDENSSEFCDNNSDCMMEL